MKFLVGFPFCRPAGFSRMKSLLRVFSLLTVLLLSAPGFAEPAPVRMRLESISLRPRSGGPIGLHVKLEYNEPQLLEGDLLLKVYDGNRGNDLLLATMRHEGIVLQGVDAFFNLLLPPLPVSGSANYEIEAWFQSKNSLLPLSADGEVKERPDTYSIIGSRLWQRGAILASVSGLADPLKLSKGRRRLHDLLSPEKFVSAEELKGNQLLWFPASCSATSMPADPLALCSYDMVLFTDGGLNQLEQEQMDAVAAWVEAGGSVCVAPTVQGLQRKHLDFLQGLLPAEAGSLILTDDGCISAGSGEQGVTAGYAGLGRCVVLSSGVDVSALDEDDAAWMREFLWKFRGTRLPRSGETFGDARKPVPESPVREFQWDGYGRKFYLDETGKPVYVSDSDAYLGLGPRSGSVVHRAQSVVMPQDVKMVPTTVILGLLLAYVLAVGPLDYWILGWLGKRRFTWIVFPLVTAGFTVLMVQVAHHYLGSNESGGVFRITDVGEDGRVLRETSLDLQFLESRRDVHQPVQRGLVCSVGSMAATTGHDTTLALAGRFPHDYTASRRIEQWSPAFLRTLTLPNASLSHLKIDWNDVRLVTTQNGRMRLRSALTGNTEIQLLRASVFHGTDGFDVHMGHVSPVRPEQPTDPYSNYPFYRNESRSRQLQLLVEAASRADPAGFLRYVAQISPSGDRSAEDCALIDSANDDQWLLVILLKTDDGYHLIRRLYCVLEE